MRQVQVPEILNGESMCKKMMQGLSVIIFFVWHIQLIAEPMNLAIARKHVEDYYDSGQYTLEMNKIIDRAISYFSSCCSMDVRKPAIVFDIDDTVVSSYQRSKEIGFGFIDSLYRSWVAQAELPLISETKRLYDHLVACHYHIIFISARPWYEKDVTIRNLKHKGFTVFDKIILRTPEMMHMTVKSYKSLMRKRLVMQGYTILASIGDQWSDLCGGYAEHLIKLPNPMYIIV